MSECFWLISAFVVKLQYGLLSFTAGEWFASCGMVPIFLLSKVFFSEDFFKQ